MNGISERDFPGLYRAADASSGIGQRSFLNGTRSRLGMLVLAASFGLFSWQVDRADVAGVVAAAAFGAALVTEIYLLTVRPDRRWYEGRAAAESAKTLTWRYLVGGSPLGKAELTDRQAESLLLERFDEIVRDLTGIHLVPTPRDVDQVTPEMRRVRNLSLDQRREWYRTGRIHDQRDWYAQKALWNERRATRWSMGLAVLELAGLTGGILKATGVVDLDLLGLTATLVGAGAAWVQTKQHQMLASAYAVACHELASLATRIDHAVTEEQWGHFVDQAEDAISREHTLWRASRT
ncbi:MAG: DUF4231 domain-containing protein [Streptosporangiales bacterium]|nr:DUF4231 domain-containing protein [Streptosporangiales bacterium]